MSSFFQNDFRPSNLLHYVLTILNFDDYFQTKKKNKIKKKNLEKSRCLAAFWFLVPQFALWAWLPGGSWVPALPGFPASRAILPCPGRTTRRTISKTSTSTTSDTSRYIYFVISKATEINRYIDKISCTWALVPYLLCIASK